MTTNKKRGGFTLMEVLIYTAILGATGAVLSGVLLNTTKIKSRQTAVIEVNEQLNFVLQNIQRSIMDSSVIDIENGVSTSTLVLKFKNETAKPATQFYISNNIIYKKEGSGTPQPLTNSKVIANAVNFLKISGYSGHDSVQIDLTLSYNTNNLESTFSRTLSSAIARVSAATFDSDLIPGSNIYDIGTSAAKWKDMYLSGTLSVNSTTASSTFTNGIELSGGCFLYNGSCLSSVPALTTGYIFIGNASNAAAATSTIYLSTASNVGIGTTAPAAKLSITHSQTGNYLRLTRSDATDQYLNITGIDESGHGTGFTFQTRDWNTSGPYVTRTGLHLAASGNVGIATTTPWGLLSVNPNGITNPAFVIGSSTSTNLIVTNGGRVGIGTATPAEKLDVVGNVQATAFYYSSDRQLKNNIHPLTGSLDKVMQLRGVSFNWKNNDKPSVGLIAQDLEKIYPELVSTNDQTGLKSVEYANLVAPLIESIKEQQKQIEELKNEISNLKLGLE